MDNYERSPFTMITTDNFLDVLDTLEGNRTGPVEGLENKSGVYVAVLTYGETTSYDHLCNSFGLSFEGSIVSTAAVWLVDGMYCFQALGRTGNSRGAGPRVIKTHLEACRVLIEDLYRASEACKFIRGHTDMNSNLPFQKSGECA